MFTVQGAGETSQHGVLTLIITHIIVVSLYIKSSIISNAALYLYKQNPSHQK